MIERAIVQQVVVGRDGSHATREYQRPDAVRDMARRVQRWKDAPEGCVNCRSDNAVSVRAGLAVCVRCRQQIAVRLAGFDSAAGRPPTIRRAPTDAALVGQAIVFDSLSVDLGGFQEIIKPQAVDRTLASSDEVYALVEHDTARPIASRHAEAHLEMRKASTGLVIAMAEPAGTTTGKDAVINIRTRILRKMSFGFIALEDDWALSDLGIVIRTVLDMHVREVSAVLFPAYPQTDIRVGEDPYGRAVTDHQQRTLRTRLAR